MLDPVSSSGDSIRDLFIIVTVIGAVVLLIVGGLVTFFALRYRGRPGAADPPPSFGNTRVEITWVIVPLIIVLTLFGLALRSARVVTPSTSGRDPDLIVIGHQWWWEVIYPETGVVSANEIHIPTGARVLLQIESADVIHDFWVPEVGRKIDAIPGHPNRIWIGADQPGTYLGACSEFCGLQHAWMRLRVIAQPQQEFDAWQQQQRGPIAAPAGTAASSGAELFRTRTCASCHAVEGTARRPDVAPNLAHLRDRETLGAGVIQNTPENLARWLQDPQAIKPGSLMPNLNLTDEQVASLVAYLEGQP